MRISEIDLTVYPDECDASGHLNQASFLSLFERARWEMLARGPGMSLFTEARASPVVRKAAVDYHAPAFPGDVLRFHQALVHLGRSSFTMRQTARRVRDDRLIATAELVFVCVGADGRPTAVPEAFSRFMATRPAPGDGAEYTTVNGVTLAVQREGEGRPVLFIHGYPLDRTIWRDQVAELAGWRRIVPDLRGFGQSDAPDLGYSMTTYAEDMVALLDRLGVDRAVICGHSMGGYIAFEMLRRARPRVAGLVLVATRATPDTSEARGARDASAAQARESGAGVIAESLGTKLFAPSARERIPMVVEQVRRIIGATPVAGIIGALSAMRDRPDSRDLLAGLRDIPTLVIGGEQDELMAPSATKEMAEAIPGAQLRIVPGAGHLPSLEQPRLTTQAITEFLEKLG